jgi:hydrogenase maturation protease
MESEVLAQAKQPSEARTRPRPTLVLGLGNILLRDEGVGVRVVQALEQMPLPPDVEVFDGATAGVDLLDVLAGRRKVVVIDAIAGDSAPGTVLRLTPDDLVPRHQQGVSLHDLGLLETLALAKQLDLAPEEVIIIGVKPHNVACGLELSAEIARAVPGIIDLVLAELEQSRES